MDDLEFRILGAFEVRRAGSTISSGGGRRRALLATLLVHPNTVVGVDRLREVLWGEHEPRSAANLIQGYVSDWRSLLSPARSARSSGARLLSSPAGYQLRVDPHEADFLQFRALAAAAGRALTTGDLTAARQALASALALRLGPPLADFSGLHPWLDAAAAALEDEWLATLTTAAAVELAGARPEAAFHLLEQPISDHPLREDLVGPAMTALYRSGRQADALALFERLRSHLSEELGADPEPELQRLHLRILRHEPPPVTGVPAPISSFVGRETESAAVIERACHERLVTLTGVGGSGKTRLALRVAPQIAARTGSRIVFVDAAPIADVGLLWHAMAAALGRRLGTESLVDMIRNHALLVVLDNLEHLVAAAPQLAELMSAAPGLRLLVTSRLPLGVVGENLFAVPPLSVPSAKEEIDHDAVLASPAVRLFTDRAVAGFFVSQEDSPTMAAICRQLDGLPLAIELAAPLTRTLSLQDLRARLVQPLSTLVSETSSTRPQRQRTMQAVIGWTYDTLSDDERLVLEALSLFVSGAQLDALSAVLGAELDVILVVDRLIRANLVHRKGSRYRLLELVREYALDRFRDRATYLPARMRHARFFAALAESTARASRTPEERSGTERLKAEQAELRTAITHLHRAGADDDGLALTVDCLTLWWDLGHIQEGYGRLTDALAAAKNTAADLRAAGSAAAAVLAESAGEPSVALRLEADVVVYARQAGSPLLEALGEALLGNAQAWVDWAGPATEGIGRLTSARERLTGLPDEPARWGWWSRESTHAFASLALIDVLRYRDPARARLLALETLDRSTRSNDGYTMAFAQRAVGAADADAGRWAAALNGLNESVDLSRRSGSLRSEGRSIEELARLAWGQGELERAQVLATAAAQASRDTGHALNLARTCALLADVTTALGDLPSARRLLDEAEQSVGDRYPDVALRSAAPRRARLARLAGDRLGAAHHLGRSIVLLDADGLTPDRVGYLIEAAHHEPDPGRRVKLVRALLGQAARLGLVLPRCQADDLAALVVQ